jgi:DNA-binding transcriptional LysR family regulator
MLPLNRLLSFELLESFVVLAEELHFTRAAVRLNVAQPALTKRIRQLEDAFGVPLFVRTRRRVQVTSEGELLLERTRELLRGAADLAAAAERLKHGESGRLRIGFSPSAPHQVLPVLVQRFRAEHPDVRLELTEAASDRQIQQLVDGEIDVGILRPPPDCPASLVCTVCFEEPFVVVLPRDHALAKRRRLALIDLKNEPFVMVDRRLAAGVHQQLLAACAAAGFTPRIVQEAVHVHAVIALVAAGCGVALLPRSAAAIRMPAIVTRPLHGAPLSTVMAVARPRQGASAAARAFGHEALRQFRSHPV